MEKSFRIFAYFAVVFSLMLGGCAQWDPDEPITNEAAAILKGTPIMTMSPVTAADYGGSLPVASILCPDAGEQVKAEDIRTPVAALLAECDDIRNNATTGLANKVDRSGDTMTDLLTINASTTNEYALRANGSGSAAGVRCVGGATGSGGVFIAGASGNGNGIEGTGSGSGFGAVLAAGTSSTATVPTRSLQLQGGGIQIAATSPNAGVDPGADNTIWPQSANSSSATFTTDGAGNITVPNAGFNIGTATIFGDNQTIIVPFARNLPGAAYRFALGEYGLYKVVITNGSRTNAGYTFKIWDIAGAAYVNVATTAVTVFVTTIGY